MTSSPRKNSNVSKPRQRGGHAPKMGRRNTEEEEEVKEEEARPYVCPPACLHACNSSIAEMILTEFVMGKFLSHFWPHFSFG
jgi:hypothetical protein